MYPCYKYISQATQPSIWISIWYRTLEHQTLIPPPESHLQNPFKCLDPFGPPRKKKYYNNRILPQCHKSWPTWGDSRPRYSIHINELIWFTLLGGFMDRSAGNLRKALGISHSVGVMAAKDSNNAGQKQLY